jgi:hypothetical protein
MALGHSSFKLGFSPSFRHIYIWPGCYLVIKEATHFGLFVEVTPGVPGYRSRGPGFDSRRYQIF